MVQFVYSAAEHAFGLESNSVNSDTAHSLQPVKAPIEPVKLN